MQLRKATRQQSKIRLGLSATSGAGKTYSAIIIALGLCGDLNKVAVIDTENGSADLYAHLGPYNVITLQAPFTPEKYIQAIKSCIDAGMEVTIIDSITHEWEELLKVSGAMVGNSYANWSKITPRHDAFIQAILQSPMHMITTVRRKQDYEMGKDSNGKGTVTKLGMKEITRDGFEYEVTANLELDTAHFATASKDRTGLFVNSPAFVPSVETGKLLRAWCESGATPIELPKQPEQAAIVDTRETLTPGHVSMGNVINAITAQGYTIEQVEMKYIITPEALQVINNAVNAKKVAAVTATPEFVQVTQADIQKNNTPAPSTNGAAKNGVKPF